MCKNRKNIYRFFSFFYLVFIFLFFLRQLTVNTKVILHLTVEDVYCFILLFSIFVFDFNVTSETLLFEFYSEFWCKKQRRLLFDYFIQKRVECYHTVLALSDGEKKEN